MEVNDYHFDGKSPSQELCEQLKNTGRKRCPPCDTWVDGVHWMNFLGQPVLGQLGGVAGLRERLPLPGITLQELSGDRVLITLGEQPDTGDVEAGRTLPLHRALARMLEPHLHQWTAKYGNEAPEELLRWDRRFLE